MNNSHVNRPEGNSVLVLHMKDTIKGSMSIDNIREAIKNDTPLFTDEQKKTIMDNVERYMEGKQGNGHVIVVGPSGLKICMEIENPNTPVPGDSRTMIKHIPVDEFSRQLHESKIEWEASTSYQELTALFKANPGLLTARKVVGIDLGSMQRLHKNDELQKPEHGSGSKNIADFHTAANAKRDQQNDHFDHSVLARYNLLFSVWEFLTDSAGTEDVLCTVQDSDLTANGAQALNNAGIKVVKNPFAFVETDDNTILISLDPSIPVKQIVVDIARPVAMLWVSSITESERSDISFKDPTTFRVKDMLKDEYAAIGVLSHEAHKGGTIYKRKNVGDAEGSVTEK
ncbi:hypothetical protein GGS21DRAFT_544028 [Xylaria nigripes]|nr:hypothetical protein GGS21DRAFT_544028 [Xylaria nigripes]